jgi:exonuclease VII small subunit
MPSELSRESSPRRAALKQAVDDLERAQASLEAATGALIRGGSSSLVTQVDHVWGKVDDVRIETAKAMQRAE